MSNVFQKNLFNGLYDVNLNLKLPTDILKKSSALEVRVHQLFYIFSLICIQLDKASFKKSLSVKTVSAKTVVNPTISILTIILLSIGR